MEALTTCGLASAAEVVEKLFAPPDAGRMTLLKWIVNLTFLIHLPYMGLLVAGTILSLLLNVLHRDGGGKNHARLAKDVLDLVTVNRAVGLILGVFPLFALMTCYGQIVYTGHVLTYGVWLGVIGLVSLGLVFVHVYREQWALRESRWFPHLLTGVSGVALLAGAYLLVFSNVLLAGTPERWPLVNDVTDILFTWNIVWRLGQWAALSWAFLGASILFFFFFWEERRKAMDDSYAAYVRKLGAGLALGFLFPAALLMVLEVYNTTSPYFQGGYAFGGPTALMPAKGAFDAALVALILCLGTGHLLWLMISRRNAQFGAHVFFLLLGVYAAWIVGNQLQLGETLKEHEMALAAAAAEHEEKAREAAAPPPPSDPATRYKIGEKVFLQMCVSCHDPALKEKRIGPPLLPRLGRYKTEKNVGDLMKWIVEGGVAGAPDSAQYQPMTPQAVRPRDLPMVAEYLLKRLEEGK
ncbi:MAG: hypothetical protein HYY17_01550 [Planctomycetes bacterium]|nr:hypothetical protein [Planctomycetota bacterium]